MTRKSRDKKRGVKFEIINLSPDYFEEILTRIHTVKLTYKTAPELYNLRDRALISTLILTGLRASEVILLKKQQIIHDGDLIRIHKARTIKGGDLREKIPLPTKRTLSKFTRILLEWCRNIPDNAYLFPRGSAAGVDWEDHIKRSRVYQIVFAITGKYPHYYRAVCATIYAKIFKDAWMLKEFFGWRNLNSSSPYVKSSWEEKEELINSVF